MQYVDEVYDTMIHCIRVGRLAFLIAAHIGKPIKFCKEVSIAGVMHDIGKMCLNQEILNKPSTLSPDEFDHIKEHVVHSADIVKTLEFGNIIQNAVMHHHESYDGSGYPDGLSGEDISLEGRIVKVCDVYDALTMNRPYRPCYSPVEALGIMLKDYSHFDKDVLKTLRSVIESYGENLFLIQNPEGLVRRIG